MLRYVDAKETQAVHKPVKHLWGVLTDIALKGMLRYFKVF
jgi:hypothetical protein